MEDRKNIMSTNVAQNLILENREKLNITGVSDVISFDDEIVMIATELGLLTIKGENLHINKLSIDSSEALVEGNINSLLYSNREIDKKSNGIMSKIFK